jgi:hypothetical protein
MDPEHPMVRIKPDRVRGKEAFKISGGNQFTGASEICFPGLQYQDMVAKLDGEINFMGGKQYGLP